MAATKLRRQHAEVDIEFQQHERQQQDIDAVEAEFAALGVSQNAGGRSKPA